MRHGTQLAGVLGQTVGPMNPKKCRSPSEMREALRNSTENYFYCFSYPLLLCEIINLHLSIQFFEQIFSSQISRVDASISRETCRFGPLGKWLKLKIMWKCEKVQICEPNPQKIPFCGAVKKKQMSLRNNLSVCHMHRHQLVSLRVNSLSCVRLFALYCKKEKKIVTWNESLCIFVCLFLLFLPLLGHKKRTRRNIRHTKNTTKVLLRKGTVKNVKRAMIGKRKKIIAEHKAMDQLLLINIRVWWFNFRSDLFMAFIPVDAIVPI